MRIWTYLGIFLAFLVGLFSLIHLGEGYLLVMLAAAVAMIGIGSVTGQ